MKMEGFKWLLFCMVLINYAQDEMTVSGLKCLVCLYLKENESSAKKECEEKNQILPCNNLAELKVVTKVFDADRVNVRSGVVQKLSSRNAGDSTGRQFACSTFHEVATVDLKKNLGVNKEGSGIVQTIGHTCISFTKEDAIKFNVNVNGECQQIQFPEGERHVYACQNEMTNGKPCNYEDKCKVSSQGSQAQKSQVQSLQAQASQTEKSQSHKLMPFATGLYISILIGIGTIFMYTS